MTDPRLAFSLSVLGAAAVLRVFLALYKRRLAGRMKGSLEELEEVKGKAEREGKHYQRFTCTLGRSTALKEAVRLLERVERRVYATSGWISHDAVIAGLLRNRRKDVRVVLKPPGRRWPGARRADVTNEEAVNEFREQIDYRVCEEVSAKMMIVDGALLLGSTNFTNQGFSRNVEADLLTEDPKLVGSAEEFFQKVWERAAQRS